MRQFLIVSLFAILLADLMLGIGLGLAPGLSLKNAFLYVLFIALILDMTIGGRDLLPEAWGFIALWLALIGYAAFTWLAISLLGLHRGYSMMTGFITLKNQLVDLFLFFLLFLYGPRTPHQALVLAKWLIGVLAIANLITLLDVFNVPDLGIMDDRADSRISGPLGSVNQFGAVLAFVIPITAGFAVATRGWIRLYFLAGAFIALILLTLTISRGAFVGLIMGMLVTLVVLRHHISAKVLRKGAVIGCFALVLVAAAVALHDPEAFLGRFDFSATTSAAKLSSGRTDTWLRALTMMSESPMTVVTGFGWNAYATLFLGYGDPHNVYLQYLFNLGLIGTGMFLAVLVWVYRTSIRVAKSADESVRPLFVGFLMGWVAILTAVFFVGLYLPWLFVWACTGTVTRLLIESARMQESDSKIPELQGT